MRSAAVRERPLVSVVVPMYNAERYIERTIGSVLRQDYPNVEIVCVDDFSTDSTVSLVSSAAKMDSRVKFFRNDQKGANSARQKGVLSAAGALLMFLDSDDELIDGSISHLVGIFLASGSNLVCANISYSEGGREDRRFSYSFAGLAVDLDQCPEAVLDVRPSACAKLFSAKLFEDMKFVDVPFAQDWNISYKSVANARRVFFSNEPVYRYQIREGSTSTRKSALKLEDLEAVISCIEDILAYRGIGGRVLPPREASVIASRFILNMVGRSFHLGAGDRRTARVYLKRAFYSLVDLVGLIRVLGVDRGRIVILIFSLSCWPAYEVVRKAWLRGGGMS